MKHPPNLVDEHAVLLLRYGSSLSHSLYNSVEVGQRAGDSIAAAFSSPFLGDSALPKLSCGRMATAPLPGGGHFLCACAAGAQPPHSVDSQVCISSLACNAQIRLELLRAQGLS